MTQNLHYPVEVASVSSKQDGGGISIPGGAVVDPTTLPGFVALWRQPDYVKDNVTGGDWPPRAESQIVNHFTQSVNGSPADTNGEPNFTGAPLIFLQGATLNSLIGVAGTNWTVFAGFLASNNVAPAAFAYDDPQVLTTGGGYWGMGYSNRFTAWYYTGATPAINIALAPNTWAIGQHRYDSGHAAASRFQARLGKTPWSPFGADPGDIQNRNQAMLLGINYALLARLIGQVRFLIFYNQALSDADADSVCDWAKSVWPVFV